MGESIGQTVDAELAVVKARLAILEAKAATDWAAAKAWAKSNFGHITLTWPASAVTLYSVISHLVKL